MTILQKIQLNSFFNRQKLTSEVLLDGLTKTIVRKYMVDYIQYLISKKIPFFIAIIDIDNFKYFNDNYGHLNGDKILIKLSELISENLPDDAWLGRFGGDEFIVLYENVSDYNDEWANLKKMITVIRNNLTVELEGKLINPTVTMGATAYPKDGLTYKELFEKADIALYRGKDKGRNCFIAYVEAKHKNLTMEVDISLAKKLCNLSEQFKGNDDPYLEIFNSLQYAMNVINADGMTVLLENKAPLAVSKIFTPLTKINTDALNEKLKDGFVAINDASKLDSTDTIRYAIRDIGFRSMVAVKIKIFGKKYGYLLVYNERLRVWQENDVSYICHLASLIASDLAYNG